MWEEKLKADSSTAKERNLSIKTAQKTGLGLAWQTIQEIATAWKKQSQLLNL